MTPINKQLDEMNGNGENLKWFERLTIMELKRLSQSNSELERSVDKNYKELIQKIDSLNASINRIEVSFAKEITALKVKSGTWGLLGGILVALPLAIYTFLSTLSK